MPLDGNRRLRFGFYVLFHIFIIVLINFNAFTSNTQNIFVDTVNEHRQTNARKNNNVDGYDDDDEIK